MHLKLIFFRGLYIKLLKYNVLNDYEKFEIYRTIIAIAKLFQNKGLDVCFVVESGDGANPNLYGTNIEKENLIGTQMLSTTTKS